MTYGTKSAIKAAYLSGLEKTYPWAAPDSPHRAAGMSAAEKAVDGALAGRIKLEGDIWFQVLADNGVQKSASRQMISDLPD